MPARGAGWWRARSSASARCPVPGGPAHDPLGEQRRTACLAHECRAPWTRAALWIVAAGPRLVSSLFFHVGACPACVRTCPGCGNRGETVLGTCSQHLPEDGSHGGNPLCSQTSSITTLPALRPAGSPSFMLSDQRDHHPFCCQTSGISTLYAPGTSGITTLSAPGTRGIATQPLACAQQTAETQSRFEEVSADLSRCSWGVSGSRAWAVGIQGVGLSAAADPLWVPLCRSESRRGTWT